MALDLFSKAFPKYTSPIENQFILDSLIGLEYYLGKGKITILKWDDNQIAIPLTVEVQLPPHSNFENIDIRSKEEILIIVDLISYPSKAPTVFTDRLDFPKDKLAHLYIAKNGKPPAFCLVRGNINEWYANKRLKDVVIRTKNWLRDAAAGELTDNGEQFDPLRLEGYRGHAIYSYDQVADIVNNGESFIPNSNFTLALFENTAKEEDYPSFKLENIITPEILNETIKNYIKSIKELIENKTFKLKKYHLGYILWSGEKDTFSNYCVQLPRAWDLFKEFCSSFKIEIAAFEEYVSQFEYNIFKEIPVIVGIKRPKDIIGFSSNIEIVNFYMEFTDADKGDKKIINNPPFHFQAHNDPLTTFKAEKISGFRLSLPNTSIIGCGALGSKIVMHFVRNGTTEFVLFDPDTISPHNLVRHSLLADSEGMNKAVALSNAIRNMYHNEGLNEIIGLPLSGDVLFSEETKEELNSLKNIFDFTASDTFLNTLINAKLSDTTNVFRANLSDQGNLGIGFLEGKDRAPRIDDLQVSLYTQALSNKTVSEWLQREYELSKTDKVKINVGVGCNSETIILSDEMVSLHAAYFAGVLKNTLPASKNETNGIIYLSTIQNNDQGFNVSTSSIEIAPFIATTAVNDKSWSIRIKKDITEIMKREMGIAMPHETGGVFIGCVNYKTKTIHVVDVITAPSDSQSNPVCFCRGISGLPERVNEINKLTGNQLGYIGEWHTHPFGPNDMSNTDASKVQKFKVEFDSLQSPLPVFLTILTPEIILPFVY
jgi:hypothetical protein